MVKLEENPEEILAESDPLEQMGYEPNQEFEENPLARMGYKDSNPLSRMGYRGSDGGGEQKKEERQTAYNQGEKRNWLRSSLDRLNKGRQKTKGVSADKKSSPENKEGLAENFAGEARDRAKEKAKKELAKVAKQRIKQAAVKLAANPYVLGGLAIVLLIIVIITIIFALFGMGGSTGKGPAIYPESAEQKEQATLLAALSGNKVSNDKLLLNVVNDEKERYQLMLENAKKWSPQLSASITKKGEEFSAKLDQLVAEKDTAKRIELKNSIQDEMLKFEGTLPFGKWISEIAIGHKDAGSLNFCKITKAGAKVACASFVSTVLWQAGVPNPIQALVDSMWKHPATRIVVNRPASKSAGYYKENEGKLKPGDVIFWGDGACSAGGSVMFDHVGIYIGNGQAVDNSSSKERIRQGIAADRGSCRVFNGAKRYGAD